jgi:hypothetical protein
VALSAAKVSAIQSCIRTDKHAAKKSQRARPNANHLPYGLEGGVDANRRSDKVRDAPLGSPSSPAFRTSPAARGADHRIPLLDLTHRSAPKKAVIIVSVSRGEDVFDLAAIERDVSKRRRNPALLSGAIYSNGRAEGGVASG